MEYLKFTSKFWSTIVTVKINLEKNLISDVVTHNLPQGTPLYMAPESLQKGVYSFASDIWALGCIFYELSMLFHPFHHVKVCVQQLKQYSSLFKNYIFQDVPSLISVISRSIYKPIQCETLNYSPSMRCLCSTMLEPDPLKRATISTIICQPIIMKSYYKLYFKYDWKT